MPNLNHRHNTPEIMDDLGYEGGMMDRSLRELDYINKWLGGNQVTLEGIEKLWGAHGKQQRLSILDLGCGSGEMLIKIAQWARKKNIDIKLQGVDANPYIVKYARRHCSEYPEICIETADIFDDDTFEEGTYHIITATLFFHHFEDTELADLFAKHKTKALWGWAINDLHRHWLAYWSIKWLTAWFSRSDMVKNDAALSVARSFRRRDWERIFAKSGTPLKEIKWRWAFRWLVIV